MNAEIENASIKWDLKEIIQFLKKNVSELKEVYLFGSHAYGTDCKRSDIDLLIILEKVVDFSKLTTLIIHGIDQLTYLFVSIIKMHFR